MTDRQWEIMKVVLRIRSLYDGVWAMHTSVRRQPWRFKRNARLRMEITRCMAEALTLDHMAAEMIAREG